MRRSNGLLGVAGAGFQLLLGPGTSGVDVTFLFLVIDAGASRPRLTRGAPSSPPHPPCARPSHPARPTHGSRTFPPLCTAHTSLARLLAPQPLCALVCADAQFSPLTSTRVDGDASRRRGGGGAARVGRAGAQGRVRGGDGARRGRLHHKEYK